MYHCSFNAEYHCSSSTENGYVFTKPKVIPVGVMMNCDSMMINGSLKAQLSICGYSFVLSDLQLAK
jgi:hypothetical protein